MKILLDENMPVKLKRQILEHDVYTVYDMNWDRLKNGILLQKAVEEKFDVFITSDKNLEFQQNIAVIQLAIIVLDIILLKWSNIEPLIPKIIELLPNTTKGRVYRVK
ncbi:MAG: DUF5615 family PIN-like protein [Leptospiraceae bacterium]|nr:DUF5615 family PIN-like protein [Leptospiraceae bacterium]MCP5497642.1 DUF5615 family PIN-like protein [Leptospiraceae bacterium]